MVLAIALASIATGNVRGGTLDPNAPRGPTMKTLDELPPQWHRKLSAADTLDPCASSRYRCVLGSAGVLDRETGLVWMKGPPQTASNFATAEAACQAYLAGTIGGWRLPTAEELRTLIDDDTSGLPAGHPFTALTGATDVYWSASHILNFATVLTVNISDGGSASTSTTSSSRLPWCVRGGRGYDGW